jgi:hypothetical protein
MKRDKAFFFAAVGILFAPCLHAASYNVSTSGNDSNPGTSAQPWRTIAKAASVMVAGDTVMVAAGSYGENVSTARAGTATGRITFRASGTAVTKTINIKHSYVTVDGFEMTGANQSTMMTISGANDELLNNTIHDTGASGAVIDLTANSDSALVKGNHLYSSTGKLSDDFPQIVIEGNNDVAENNEIGPVPDADAFRVWGNNNVVRGNYIHGITLSPGGAAHTDVIQAWGTGIGGVIFENNLIDQTGVSGNLQMFMTENNGNPTTGSWEMRNNIYISVPGQANIGIPNLHFYNNTVYISGQGNNLIMFMYNIAGKGDYTGTIIKNNIFVTPTNLSNYSGVISYDGAPASKFSGVQVDYNLVTRVSTFGTVSGFNEAHGISGGNPQFVNAGSKDFHLLAASPAINKGVALTGFNTDRDGVARPQGAGWDIGAYEFGSGAPPPPPPSGSACDVNSDGSANVVDVQSEVNQALGIATCKADINKDGQCTVVDVQRVVNAALGGQCVTQ